MLNNLTSIREKTLSNVFVKQIIYSVSGHMQRIEEDLFCAEYLSYLHYFQ